METLFVLLVIALVVSFAMPAFRSVRNDIKNTRAKTALKKLAEARKTFYQFNKGTDIATAPRDGALLDQVGDWGSWKFAGSSVKSYAGGDCNSVGTGIPGTRVGVGGTTTASTAAVSELFACRFLDWRDFEGLPYTFAVCPTGTGNTPRPPCDSTGRFVAATGSDGAGSEYTGTYRMWVNQDNMQVTDTKD